MARQFIVSKLRELCDPTVITPWEEFTKPIRPTEVLLAVKEGRLRDRPGCDSRREHIERAAYLVVHGWKDPIELDVGIPELGFHVSWPIMDGNHRFLAAIVRGDERIAGDGSGSVRFMKRLCRRRKSNVLV